MVIQPCRVIVIDADGSDDSAANFPAEEEELWACDSFAHAIVLKGLCLAVKVQDTCLGCVYVSVPWETEAEDHRLVWQTAVLTDEQ